MAEENLFNPLDDLGPEFGGINRPGSDASSYLPFEGDKIKTPEINFPKPPAPFSIPGVRNLTRPNFNIKQNIVNNPGVIKSAPKTGKVNIKDLMTAQQDYLKSLIQSKSSNEEYVRMYAYDASPDGGAFYDRYAAYGQETFDKIGFHPLRDNEALFNARTTKADDWSRMISHSFLPMFGKGFTDGPKSMWKMIQGDFTGTDLEGAEEYERLAAIGSSSKGGAFGFVNNTVMNFGYTAGIISEAIVEELAGLALAPLTGGSSVAVTTANNARKIPSLFKGIKGFNAAYDASKAVGNTLKALNNSNSARKFWGAANRAGTSKLGRFLNPLENTVDAITGIKATDNLTGFAKTFRTAGGFYRDVRNLNMALSEARLEAGMVENKVYKDGYNAHYEKFGTSPTNDIQEALISTAKQASYDTLTWNTALIYASNKITFNNITGPRGGIRNFVRANIDDVMKAGNGKFGTVGKIIYDNSKKQFARQGNDFMSWAKGWAKDPLYKSAGKTIGYFKSNFTEGLQENAQEIISGANFKYYTDAFKSSVLKSNLYSRGVSNYANNTKFDYYKDELGEQFTEQGLETFASGFLMGTLAAPLNGAVPMLSIGYNRLFNNTEYQEYKARKEDMLNGIVKNLNSLGPKEFYDSRIFNTAVQDMAADVKKYGSKKQAYDATDEAFISQVSTAMETGSLYLFKERMSDMKNMTAEEIEKEVPGIEKGDGQKYLNRLDDIIDRIDVVEKRYNYYKERFPNPISLDVLNEKDPEFNAKVQLYTGWNLAVKNAVFFNESFESAQKRKVGIKNKITANKPFQSISDTEVNSLLDNLVLGKEISNLRNEINSLEELQKSGTLNPELRKDLENKKKKLDSYTQLFTETEKFNSFFNRYENIELIKQSMKKEFAKRDIKVEDLTDEQVIEALDKNLGAFDDVNKAEKIQAYKRSVDKYLKSIADISNDNVFDEKLDEIFNDLIDYQKLDSESKKLVRYNNLLHNPEEFLKLVERNTEWLKSLYDNRETIFKDIVTEQMSIVEANALLNSLADKGIYMSVDDFSDFIKNGTKPKEFFNEPANEVYREGTAEYEEIFTNYLAKFNSLRPKKSASQEEDELFGQDLDLDMIFEDEETVKKTKEELYNSYTPEQKASIKKIEELIKLQENVKAGEILTEDDPVTKLKAGEKAYLINKLFHRRVTNAIKDVEASDYQYVEKATLENIFEIAFGGSILKENTGAEDFTFKGKTYVKDLVPTEGGYNIKVSEKLEDGTIKPLSETESSILSFVYLAKTAELPGFRDTLYEELADELTNILQSTTTNPVAKADIEKLEKQLEITKATIPVNKKGIDSLEKQIAEAKAELTALGTTDTSTQPVNISNEDLYNQIYKFISENTYEDGREAGNYVDQAAKDFLGDGKMPEFDPNKISKKAYLDLFGPEGHLTQIKKRIDNGELYIVAKGLVVYDSNIEKLDGTTDRIAGEIDLIAVDRKGKVHIIDIKTGDKRKWLNFNYIQTKEGGPKSYSKRENYTLQQATYATLLKRMIGVDASVSILPIERSSESETGKILNAGRPEAKGIYQPLIYKRNSDGVIIKNKFGHKEFEVDDSAQVSEMLIPLYIASVRDEMNTLFPITRYKDETGEYVEEMIDLSGVSKTMTPKDKIDTLITKYNKATEKIDDEITTIKERLSKFKINENFDNIDLSENSAFVQEQLQKDSIFANVFKVHEERFLGKISYAPTPGQLLAIDVLSTGLLTQEEIDIVKNANPSREKVSEIIHEAVKRIQYLKTNSNNDVVSKAYSNYQSDITKLIGLNNTNAQDKSILDTFNKAVQATTSEEIQDAVNSLNVLQAGIENSLNNKKLSAYIISKIEGRLKDVKDFNANFKVNSGYVDIVDIFADPIESTIDGENIVQVNDIYYLNRDTNSKMVVTKFLENGDIVLKLATKQNTPKKNAKEMIVSPSDLLNNFVKESQLNKASKEDVTYTTSPTEKEILQETFDAQDTFISSDESKGEAYKIGIESDIEDIKSDLINKFKNCQ